MISIHFLLVLEQLMAVCSRESFTCRARSFRCSLCHIRKVFVFFFACQSLLFAPLPLCFLAFYFRLRWNGIFHLSLTRASFACCFRPQFPFHSPSPSLHVFQNVGDIVVCYSVLLSSLTSPLEDFATTGTLLFFSSCFIDKDENWIYFKKQQKLRVARKIYSGHGTHEIWYGNRNEKDYDSSSSRIVGRVDAPHFHWRHSKPRNWICWESL